MLRLKTEICPITTSNHLESNAGWYNNGFNVTDFDENIIKGLCYVKLGIRDLAKALSQKETEKRPRAFVRNVRPPNSYLSSRLTLQYNFNWYLNILNWYFTEKTTENYHSTPLRNRLRLVTAHLVKRCDQSHIDG